MQGLHAHTRVLNAEDARHPQTDRQTPNTPRPDTQFPIPMVVHTALPPTYPQQIGPHTPDRLPDRRAVLYGKASPPRKQGAAQGT